MTNRLSKQEARDLTKRIGGLMGEIEDFIVQAWRGFADEALGYATWEEYVVTEFSNLPKFRLEARKETGKKLREATKPQAVGDREEMSTRAIGVVVGASHVTVQNDLSGKKLPVRSTPPSPPPQPTIIDAAEAYADWQERTQEWRNGDRGKDERYLLGAEARDSWATWHIAAGYPKTVTVGLDQCLRAELDGLTVNALHGWETRTANQPEEADAPGRLNAWLIAIKETAKFSRRLSPRDRAHIVKELHRLIDKLTKMGLE